MAMANTVVVNCRVVPLSQAYIFLLSLSALVSCVIASVLLLILTVQPEFELCKKGMSFNDFLWMVFHLGRKRASLVQRQRDHPSTKSFLLCEVSLEFQRRTWNFSVPVYFLCRFKTRRQHSQWNNCSYFSWVPNNSGFQPVNAYHFTVTKQFMIISPRIYFSSQTRIWLLAATDVFC